MPTKLTNHHEQDTQPLIWLILGDKQGDNAQVELIAHQLCKPFLIKHIVPRNRYVFGKPRFRASLYHLDLKKTDPLEQPWPDLIITVGRRASMAALWVKKQSNNHSKVVLLGRPRRWLEKFDLVISPLQYRTPEHENIHKLGLPLFEIDHVKLVKAQQQWQTRIASLQQPVTALFIGGPTRPFIMNQETTLDLLDKTQTFINKTGGSLYVSTSRRTPTIITKTLQTHLPTTTHIYHWGDPNTDNPYMGLMAHADFFIVTGDSVSMMVEVAKLGKPLAIYPLRSSWIGALWQRITFKLNPSQRDTPQKKIAGKLGDFLYSIGWIGFPRDLTQIHRYLINKGLATKLGEPILKPTKKIPTSIEAVIERINQILA